MSQIDEVAGATTPFVLCRTNGGPHDDEAFMSGWRLGDLAATLAQPGVNTLVDSIRPNERYQADLIAMARGFTMSVAPTNDPEWVSVTFMCSGW
jgi:hypothetical protein